ncbi:MAG TPA: DEAD/DEAH box helicase, partial [Pseudomonas sp.]|nr:DEAD/DEAH box helicase [Pseudomonas sp.]
GLRLPCFLIDEHVSLLPAFGEFTGGWEIEPASTSQVYLAGAGRVWPL